MANTLPNMSRAIVERFAARTNPPSDARTQANPMVRWWLLLAAAIVLLTLSVGGMTRLTNSGLSITEWDPIMGIVPPTTPAEWQEAFDKYKTTYEYRFVNMNMTVDEFRYIYNWEWRHRLFARLVFLAVFLPFIVFLLAGRMTKSMQTKVLIILGLIVFQGFIGWFMVQSGLRNEVRVSPYRLALHLGLASLLFAMLVAMAFGQDRRDMPTEQDLSASRVWGRVIIGLLFGLILFGALVAGLRGGRTHDTWPLMEGSLLPANLFAMSPWIANFFENPLTAQWVHRLLAYALIVCAVLHWRGTVRRDEPDDVQQSARWLMYGVVAQIILGIITVLNQVPIPLGLAHQLWAFLLLALAIWHLFEIERHVAPTTTTTWGRTAPAAGASMSPGAAAPDSLSTVASSVRQVGPTSPIPVNPARTAVDSPTPPAPLVTGYATGGPPTRPTTFPSIGTSHPNGERTAGPVSPAPYRRPLDS